LPLQGFEVTHLFLNFSMMMRTRLSDAFHCLVPNVNFYCQTALKNAKDLTYLAVKNASWQIWLQIQIG